MTSSSRCSHSDSIDGVVHDAVAEPESVEAVRSAVAQAAAEGSTVAPVGGRTRLDVGNPPDSVDLMLSSRRLERLVRHTPDDLTAEAEAGITIERLQNELAGHGQYLAVDPPLPERATLGGTLAVGFSGPAKWQYGNVRDCVIGLSVVQADGNLTKSGGQVVKNVSGYDLARMHVGALGTLGMIVVASLKLTPLPRTESTLLAGFRSFAASWRAALAVFRSRVAPLALTVFDEHAARLLGLPADSHAACLAVRLGGRKLTVERYVREIRAELSRSGDGLAEELDPAYASTLWNGLRDFGWGENSIARLLTRAMVRSTDAQAAAEALMKCGVEDAPPAIIGHPAHGTISAGWFGNESSPATALRQARKAVEDLGGRLVIERCPVRLKSEIDVWGDPGPALATMRRLKEQFDPERIFNPGRYVGGI